MALEFKLTDAQLRPSQEFLDFLHRFSDGEAISADWYDQLSEKLRDGNSTAVREKLASKANQPLNDPRIQQAYLQSYRLTLSVLLGDISVLRPIRDRHAFVFVVGSPRSGGSYLTKQLFLALGLNPSAVPGLLAHDGYPKAWPFYLDSGHNGHTDMTRYMAEYLVMTEMFFAGNPVHEGRIVVPKKDLNAAYHGTFYNRIFGEGIEYLFTVRHPVTCCISIYEKSGGWPKSGKFVTRGNSENFVLRDNALHGLPESDARKMDYFPVYLRYWEHYHYKMALSGLNERPVRVVAYTEQSMRNAAAAFHQRWGSTGEPEKFHVFDKRDRHPDWFEAADQAMQRVAAVWDSVGLTFPLTELREAW